MSQTQEGLALGFSNFSVISKNPTKYILHEVSGYVKYGCITAVMGPSAAGKSVLLQALSGRIQDLTITGEVFVEGSLVDPKRVDNPVAYVPQEDSVIGELTAREMTRNTATFKRDEPAEVIEDDVNKLLADLGLSAVADGIIGTLVFRGLSGGQKKRVEISTELIASPTILFMDEPTSGLDSSISFDVLTTVKNLVKSSNGKLSVLLSIHQPNYRILELFDNLLLLDRGSSIFFGTIPESIDYFNRIGFQCPNDVTPTDYFLLISNSNFSYVQDDFDFPKTFTKSKEYKDLRQALSQIKDASTLTPTNQINTQKYDERTIKKVPFSRQLYTLIYREFTLAYRDPTLYYFQLAMMLNFALLIGAIFFQLPHRIDENFNDILSGLIWIVFMASWIHVFKVYHISQNDRRARHEIANNKYSALCFFCADAISTALLLTMLTTIPPIVYFMMGFPGKAYPFIILQFWVTCIASESMLSFVTKFSKNPTVSMVLCQLVLLVIMIFAGGLFLPWKDCPDYWVWLQEITILTQSSRTLYMEVFDHLSLECTVNANGTCTNPVTFDQFACDSYFADNKKCYVLAREVMRVTQGISEADSHWKYFGYLCCIYVCFKLLILALVHFPWERVLFKLQSIWAQEHDSLPPPDTITKSSKSSKSVMGASAVVYTSVEDYTRVAVSPEREREREAHRPHASTAPPAALCWKNISVILPKNGARLIDDVSGYVSSGRILALMGPSGAGKTTLLNALAGRAPYAKVSGEVVFSQRKMTSADLTYVPQFDEVNSMLTVQEHFSLVGQLTSDDAAAAQDRAEMLLEVLGLETKKDTLVRDLTGGEVKRVSVGIGMMSNPNVLFLDEPTTGLDSTAAFSIVKYLVTVARSTNVAVIMTIHQPSALVFQMLDDLLLLESGRIVYGGSIEKSKSYFASLALTNPDHINYADYYLDLVQCPVPNSPKTWTEHFLVSEWYSSFAAETAVASSSGSSKPPPVQPSALARFTAMLSYFMVYFYREKGFYAYRLVVLIVVGVFGGTLYRNLQPTTANIPNYAGALIYSCMIVLLSAVAPTGLFAKDRREAVDRVKNGIFSPGLFVLCQTLASAVYNLVIIFIYICLYHWLVNFNPRGESFVYDIFIAWSFSILQEAVLMCCIEALKNDFLCTTAGMNVMGTFLLGSGFFRKTEVMPVWINWISYMMPMKWGFDGYVWQIFYGQDWEVAGSDPVGYLSAETILGKAFKLYDTPSWGFFGVLLGYVALFRALHYFLFALQTGSLHLPGLSMASTSRSDMSKTVKLATEK